MLLTSTGSEGELGGPPQPSLLRPSMVLATKIPRPGKPLSPRQTGTIRHPGEGHTFYLNDLVQYKAGWGRRGRKGQWRASPQGVWSALQTLAREHVLKFYSAWSLKG